MLTCIVRGSSRHTPTQSPNTYMIICSITSKYVQGWVLQAPSHSKCSQTSVRTNYSLPRKFYSLHSHEDAPNKVQARRRTFSALHCIDEHPVLVRWVNSVAEVITDGERSKQPCAYGCLWQRGARGPGVSSSVGRAQELGNQSLALRKSREICIIRLLFRTDALAIASE